MDEWNTKHHGDSGLTQKCIESKLTVQQAEQQIINFIEENHIRKGDLTIAGNSVYVDKNFIGRYMPKLNAYLHYRILDVSSLKTFFGVHRSDWVFAKKCNHRALDDIK